MRIWALLSCLAFVNAVFLNGDRLSGYEIYTIAFQQDESAAIPYLEYQGELLPKVKEQLGILISNLFMDDNGWVAMWKRWRKEHDELSENYWEEDREKYLFFAKLIFCLDGQKTPIELNTFERMLMAVPKDPLFLTFKTEAVSLALFMFLFVTARLSMWSYLLVANPRTLVYLFLEIYIQQLQQPNLP